MKVYCLLSFLIPVALVFLLNRALIFKNEEGLTLLNLCLSLGLGGGLSAFSYFVFGCLLAIDAGYILMIETGLLMTVTFLYQNRSGGTGLQTPPSSGPGRRPGGTGQANAFLAILFLTGLAVALSAFVLELCANPHGRWDAWTIWNMKARILYMGGSQWADVFSAHLTHPDYPLLLPSLVARSWTFYGHRTQFLPAIIALIFTFAAILLLYASLSVFKSRAQGILGSLLLMSTPFFIEDGAGLCADVPLAYYVLCVYVLFLFSARSPANDHYCFMIGLTAGCAVWTKNEGMLFAAILFPAHLILTAGQTGFRRYLKQLVFLGAGFLPLFFVVLFVKYNYPVKNDLLSSLGMSAVLSSILDGSRYGIIARTFGEKMMHWGDIFFPVPVVLVLYLLLAGTEIPEGVGRTVRLLFITLFLMLCGYAAIFLFTPHDLPWHLNTALDRLLLHIWPGLILCFFLVAALPEKPPSGYS